MLTLNKKSTVEQLESEACLIGRLQHSWLELLMDRQRCGDDALCQRVEMLLHAVGRMQFA